jgi:hypothetical protein
VIVNVPAGTYDIVTTLIGYRDLRMRGFRVVADLRSKVEIRLEQSTVELGEIEVTAEPPPILRDVILGDCRAEPGDAHYQSRSRRRTNHQGGQLRGSYSSGEYSFESFSGF